MPHPLPTQQPARPRHARVPGCGRRAWQSRAPCNSPCGWWRTHWAADPLLPMELGADCRRRALALLAGVAVQAEAGQYKGEDNIFPTVKGKESAAAPLDDIKFNMTVGLEASPVVVARGLCCSGGLLWQLQPNMRRGGRASAGEARSPTVNRGCRCCPPPCPQVPKDHHPGLFWLHGRRALVVLPCFGDCLRDCPSCAAHCARSGARTRSLPSTPAAAQPTTTAPQPSRCPLLGL